jgi:ABC-type bacteriocin/lantibiotic exporter with double-glycine peptidase domain
VTGWTAALAVALLGSTGCVSYAGRARPLDVNRLSTESGWIVAAPTPEVRQLDAKDCGAASLAMVAGRWHVPLSIDEVVAALPAPSERGIRLGDLRDVARAHGLTAFVFAGDRETLVKELRAGRPAIVGLRIPAGFNRVKTHFEVIFAVRTSDEQFVTIDPATGWRVRSWADLDAEWTPAGRPMLVVTGMTNPRPM